MEKSIAQVSPAMTQITLTEAQLHLSELIAKLQPGEEVQICQDDRPSHDRTPKDAKTSPARKCDALRASKAERDIYDRC
jgi:antitoxin (DNA-binding transcriptional repressor) of toxin-antitoxin stability system